MRKFKLISLSCTGKGSKVFHSRDNKIISENEFIDADELVKGGFIKEVTDNDELKEVKTIDINLDLGKEPETKGNVDINTDLGNENKSDVLFSFTDNDELKEVKTIEDINKKQIIKLLVSLGVEHNINNAKEPLFDLLLKSYEAE